MKKPPLPKTKKSLPPKAKKKKDFKIEAWTGQNEGQKIILYGESGMGKTTLSALAPDPVYVGLDDGGRQIRNPLTGEPLKHVPGIIRFQDVLDVLNSPNVFKDYKTVCVDTVTELEQLAIPYVLQTVPNKKGQHMSNIEQYGWKEGYRHLWDVMHKILVATDKLIKAGKNVIFIAQCFPERVANPGGEDFLRDAPELYSGKPSNVAQFVSWADHVFKIDYEYINVDEKKAYGNTNRIVRTHPEIHYRAKSRTLPVDYKIVSFENVKDASIWKLVFEEN